MSHNLPNVVRSSTNPSPSNGVPFVFPLVLLFITVLQNRAVDLWSESRILRKVHVLRERREAGDVAHHMIGSSATGEYSIEHRFSNLYISLSKGRHRVAGRLSKFLFILFFFLLDYLDHQPLLEDNGFVSQADVVVGMRMMVYVGSFTVLGARVLSPLEVVVGLAVCVSYALSLWFLPTKTENPLEAYFHNYKRIIYITRLVLLGLQFLIVEIPGMIQTLRGRSTHIADIANAIRVRSMSRNKAQQKRFDEMVEAMHAEREEECEKGAGSVVRRGERGGQYWPWGLVTRAASPLIVLATNGVTWGGISMRHLPTLVVVETLECMSWILLLVNDTQVEPRLFVDLLYIAERGAVS